MPAVLRHKQEAVFQDHEIDGTLDMAFAYIPEILEKWTNHCSGCEVDRVELLWLDIAHYRSLRSGSYIPLPAALRNKQTLVNVNTKKTIASGGPSGLPCSQWTTRSMHRVP